MAQIGFKGRHPRVEQLVATVHICLQQISGRLPRLDRAQRGIFSALMLALSKHERAAPAATAATRSLGEDTLQH